MKNIQIKNIRSHIDQWICDADQEWKKIPLKKQRKYIMLFFSCYLLVTFLVFLTIWFEGKAEKQDQKSSMQHIRNPLLPKNAKGLQAGHISTSKSNLYENR